MEEVKPVNLPFTPPNLVGTYNTPNTEKAPTVDAYQESINRIQQMTSSQPQAVSQYTGKELGLTSSTAERFPVMYPGRDNEEIYAQSQETWEKAYNGVVKMAGLATSTFIQGTAGLVYGVYEAANTGKFSSLYSNDLSKKLNEWTDSLEDSNAHYRTQREREGSWWELSNLFTANFLFDNIVKNIGFSLGAMASGVAWGAGLKAIGLTSKLVGAGEEMAAKAEAAIGEATSLPKAERLGSIVNKLEGLSAKGLMNSDRIITAAMGTVGESGIEALSNSQQFRENMINQFRETHGYNPSTEDMKEIDRYAENVGNWSFALNSALLTATNYIQLPKVFGSTFKGEKQLANNIALQEGKYVATLPTEGFGKFLYKSKNIVSLFFEGSEAFEEGAQYAIQTGTQNYYERRYNSKDASALDDGILKGVREALTTDEGLLNVFTGGFSGGLMTSGIFTLGRTGKISERGFKGYGGEQAILRDEAIKSLNSTMLRDKFKDVYGNIKASESIQKDREAAIRRGDILESKDLEFDYAHTFVTSRLKYNAKDAIDNEINNIKLEASTNEGFIKLQQEGIVASTDTKESFIKRLDNLQQHANYASELYKAAEIKYKGKLDEDNKPIYSDEVIDKMVYAGAKVMNYNQRIPEVVYNLSKNGIDTLTIANEISNGKLTEASIKDAVDKIKQLGSIEEDDLLNDLRDFVELSLRKKQFITEYNDIKNSPLKYKEEKSTLKKDAEQTPIVIKDKEGEREVEVGEEYYIGEDKDYINESGERVKHFGKLTILGENIDGTIKIKEASGKIRDINKKELESYKLGKVSDVEKSENSSFYFRNKIKKPDNEFFWNIGKKNASKEFPEGIIPGTLNYDWHTDKLYFTYTQNGKVKNKEVGLDEFKPKGEFTRGVFFSKNKSTGEVNELSTEDQKNISDRETSGKTKKDQESRRGDKLRVLNNLYNSIIQSSDRVNKLLEQKKAELENISKELSELEERILSDEDSFDKRFKKPTFKPAMKKALASAERLQRMQEQLTKEISDLEEQKATLDIEKEDLLPYIQDMAQNIDELPSDNKEFLEELKEQKSNLEEAILSTETQIEALQSIADKVQTTLDSIIEFVSDLIDKFRAKYPKAPTTIVAQEWIDFLKANPNFLKRKPNYREDLKQLEDLVAQVEDLDIIPSERHLKELNDNIKELQSTLKASEDRLKSIEKVMSKFEEIAKKNEERKQEEILLEKNKALQSELLGTHTSRPSTETNNKEVFDPIPKKSLMDVVNSTTVSTSLVKPHQQRANRFGFNLPKFKKEFKGVVVTAKTEGSILKGLTKYLLFDNPDSDQETFIHTTKTGRKLTYNVNNIIALVVTDEDGNLVDENGKKLPEGLSDKEKLDRAIYQVFPEELQAEYFNPETQKWEVQSMFRKDESPEQVASLEKQYNEWRNRTLQRETLPIQQKIDASFGTPEYNMKTTEVMVNGKPVQKTSIDYDNRTSVKEAGLITEGMLKTNLLIDISTTNDEIKEGKVSLKNTLGKVFLRIPNQGLVKLFNRKFNKKEAETIFSVIEQLCKNLYKKYEGKLSDEELSDVLSQNKIFTNWLDSVVYWGIPKDKAKGGFNSVWFDGGKLNISGKGTQFDFTPSNLAANKATIITLIEGMYHDSSVRLLKEDNFGNKYKQIVGIKEDGTPEFKEWQNYQTYLLSPEGRTKEEIPLTTILRLIEDSTDVNRKGIYFTLTDSEFELPKEAPATTVQKEIKNEVEQEKKAKEEAVNKVESVILEDVKFPTMSQIDNSENELANREHYKKLKSQYEKLKELFKCI